MGLLDVLSKTLKGADLDIDKKVKTNEKEKSMEKDNSCGTYLSAILNMKVKLSLNYLLWVNWCNKNGYLEIGKSFISLNIKITKESREILGFINTRGLEFTGYSECYPDLNEFSSFESSIKYSLGIELSLNEKLSEAYIHAVEDKNVIMQAFILKLMQDNNGESVLQGLETIYNKENNGK